MRLLLTILAFLLRKFGVAAAVLLSLFLSYLLIQAMVPALREAMTDRDRLEQVAEERAAVEEDLEQLRSTAAKDQARAIESLQRRVTAEVAEGRRNVTATKAEIERLRDDEREVCGPIRKAISWLLPGNACKAAERATKAAEATLDTIQGGLDQAESEAAVLGDSSLSTAEKLDRLSEGGEQSVIAREIAAKEAELAQKKAEEESLKDSQASGVGWVLDQWDKSWRWLGAIALLVLFLPMVLRTISYFVLMPLVNRAHKPILLADKTADATAALDFLPAQRTLTVQLAPGEVLSARSEHVRPVQGKIRSQLLYDWKSPFISFAAGLHSLSRITGDEGVTRAVLATPEDPDSYLMRIDFTDHPGVVMHPKHVVGVIGAPELTTRWRWGIQSFATWQVRYIMFAGTGSLIVQGRGDVGADSPGGRSTRMEQNLVMGFDSRLVVGVHRTEVFWPYLRGKTPLVDDEFTGRETFFWQKSSYGGPSNPIAKTFDAIFSALGKLLGF